MERYLAEGVKSVIDQFPAVGKLLDDYNIGCSNCMVGTCLLGDIVSVHNLSPEVEAELMAQIESVIYPDREIKTKRVYVSQTQARQIQYSPPVQELVDEHTIIKRFLALIPSLIAELDRNPEKGWARVKEGAYFGRYYADRFHHAKEEDILFGYSDESSEIIQSMYEEHTKGRNHLQHVLDAVLAGDKAKASSHLLAYRELLTEHIRKEDEILYPWIDRSLTIKHVGEIFAKFTHVNSTMEDDCPEQYIRFVDEVEQELAPSA